MKKFILFVLIVITIGTVSFLILTKPTQPTAPRVTLSDGTTIRILGVTYGTNHVVGTGFGKMVARMPDAMQDFLLTVFGSRATPAQIRTTATPELMVWVDFPTNASSPPVPPATMYFVYLGDRSNFVSGAESTLTGPMTGMPLDAVSFSVFPRRDREIKLNIFKPNSTGITTLCGNITFANPFSTNYPEWKAEPLPATKRTGDLEVTLQSLETGHNHNSSFGPDKNGRTVVEYGTDRPDGRNNTVVDLKMTPLTNTDEVWQAVGVEVSDATGNRVHSTGMSWNGGISTFGFSPGLWPDEAAWKIKLELKRTAGFRPEETFTFKNVPLGELDHTNIIGRETNFDGVSVILQSVYRREPNTNNSWSSSSLSDVHFTISSPTNTVHVDLLRSVCDSGQTNNSVSISTGDRQFDYYFKEIPVEAKTADFTFAVQQSRTVEFTVKPELPQPRPKSDTEKKRKKG